MSVQRPNMALQRTRRPRLRSGRSLCSLGSPLNARPFGGREPQRSGRSPRMNWSLREGGHGQASVVLGSTLMVLLAGSFAISQLVPGARSHRSSQSLLFPGSARQAPS